MESLTPYIHAGVDHLHQQTLENYAQTDTTKMITKNTEVKEYEVMDLKYKKRHETMETLEMAMDETVTVQQLKRDLYAVEEVAIQEINEYIEIIQ